MDVAALIVSILGLLGGAISFVVAQLARRKAAKAARIAQDALQKSADAQADAAAALARSADSGDRIAVAVEHMVARSSEPDVDLRRVFEEAVNARVEWAIEERTDAHSYRLRNTGNVRAEDVKISAVPPKHAALLHGGDLGDLDAGQVGVFVTAPRVSLSLRQIAVSWGEGGTAMSTELNLP